MWLAETTIDELYYYYKESSRNFTAFAHIERELHEKIIAKMETCWQMRIIIFLKVFFCKRKKEYSSGVKGSSLVTNEDRGCRDNRFYNRFLSDILSTISC